MKIEDTGRVRSTGPVARSRGPAPAQNTASTASIAPIADRISVLGIPPEEITPKVREAIMRLLREVDVLRSEVEDTQRRLIEMERLADLDPLAPIANRRAFVRELSRVISYAERYDIAASLLFFDVNDLKKINDRFGHAAGDAALMHIAATLIANLRESDTVGRLGGDEFAVILVQSDEPQALLKGAQLSKLIAETPYNYRGHSISLGVAFGAYTFQKGEKPTEIIDRADQRMYAQKRSIKNGDNPG